MKVIIVSGGKPPSNELLKKEISDCDYLICADSGANFLYENNICPQLLVGDFDSINQNVLNFFKKNSKCKIEKFPKQKNDTDSELAVYRAIELGADEITLLGFTGTRIDHLLGNLGLLYICLEKGVKATLKDDNNKIFLTNKPIKIYGNKDDLFSIQAYCNVVKSLSIKGGKYPLDNYDLILGDSRTISNEFLNNEVELNFSSGNLLVILPND